MLQVNLPVADTVHEPLSNNFVAGVEITVTRESKLYDSPGLWLTHK